MFVSEGVMVVKDGKAWGITYEDSYSTEYGWTDMEFAPIHDPKYCKSVLDVTHKGSIYTHELLKGKLVKVRRTTAVEIVD